MFTFTRVPFWGYPVFDPQPFAFFASPGRKVTPLDPRLPQVNDTDWYQASARFVDFLRPFADPSLGPVLRLGARKRERVFGSTRAPRFFGLSPVFLSSWLACFGGVCFLGGGFARLCFWVELFGCELSLILAFTGESVGVVRMNLTKLFRKPLTWDKQFFAPRDESGLSLLV